MQYNSLISAIPLHWRKHMKNVDSIKKHENVNNKYNVIMRMKQKLVSKKVYSELINTNFENIQLEKRLEQHINVTLIDTAI